VNDSFGSLSAVRSMNTAMTGTAYIAAVEDTRTEFH